MGKKFLKLVDNRGVSGHLVTELRGILHRIDKKEIISMSFVTIDRSGIIRRYSNSDDHLKSLGAVELLKSHIMDGFNKISPEKK